MPVGADQVSDALLEINDANGYDWSAFLINSDRDDGQMCICTAGHNVKDFAVGEILEADGYMKYLGKLTDPENDPSGKLGDVVSGYKSVMDMELVAMANDIVAGDWAVLLVSPDVLPVRDYVGLGCAFDPALYSATVPPGKFFIIAHPHTMPQRIADSMYTLSTFETIPALSPFRELWPMVARVEPGGMEVGASGAAVMYKSLPDPVVAGIFKSVLSPSEIIPEKDVPLFSEVDLELHQSGGIRVSNISSFTKMNAPALMAAIKEHCRSKDSLKEGSDSRYKKSVRVDNAAGIGEFSQNRAITSQMQLEAAADVSYGTANLNSMLVKAARITMNCLIDNKPGKDKLYCLAREAVLEAGFSYLAVGAKHLSINTVVIEPGLAGKPSAPQKDSVSEPEINIKTSQAPFNLYPNPSHDGIFYISFPVSAAGCRLEVMSTDGRLLHSQNSLMGASPYKLVIPGLNRGMHVLSLYDKKNGKMLFSQQIVYK